MKLFAMLGAILGALSVAAGAFGAHALQAKLEPRMLEVWQTAAQYQMYHALALLLVATLGHKTPVAETTPGTVAGWAFFIGVLLFSGSLYAMALSGIRALGAITPIGGTAFIIGWIALAIAASRL
jgi:uncharacterized membrane protein YgdD (TMEM256/DUF423 family)